LKPLIKKARGLPVADCKPGLKRETAFFAKRLVDWWSRGGSNP
jgi:hypothetical protein